MLRATGLWTPTILFQFPKENCKKQINKQTTPKENMCGGEGVNEVHYGQNGKLKTFDVPASTRLQIKKIISSIVLGNVKMVNSNFKTLFSVPRISAPLA